MNSTHSPSMWHDIHTPVSQLPWSRRAVWFCALAMSLLVATYMGSWVPCWYLNVTSGTRDPVLCRINATGISVVWFDLFPLPPLASLRLSVGKGPATEPNGVGYFSENLTTVRLVGPGLELRRGKTSSNKVGGGVY